MGRLMWILWRALVDRKGGGETSCAIEGVVEVRIKGPMAVWPQLCWKV